MLHHLMRMLWFGGILQRGFSVTAVSDGVPCVLLSHPEVTLDALAPPPSIHLVAGLENSARIRSQVFVTPSPRTVGSPNFRAR